VVVLKVNRLFFAMGFWEGELTSFWFIFWGDGNEINQDLVNFCGGGGTATMGSASLTHPTLAYFWDG
jgi:hypothetical protein